VLGAIFSVAVFACGRSLYSRHQLEKKNVLKSTAVDVNDVKEANYEPFRAYLTRNGKTPIEYVCDKFKTHDVILLGELHEVRENCEFVSALVGPVRRDVGVKCLALECIKHKDTDRTNRLVTAAEYDETLATIILRNCGWPKEYRDILKAVWEANRNLPVGAAKIKVLGLDSDWDAYGLLCGSLWNRAVNILKVSRRDDYMADILRTEILEKNAKALVQIGYEHSFLDYRQPLVEDGKLVAEVPPRVGNVLYGKYGGRIFQICLHQWHFGPEMARLTNESSESDVTLAPVLGGMLETVFRLNGDKEVGLDVSNSPFAPLRDRKSCYFAFQRYVSFSDIAPGYVFLKPLAALHKVTWIRGFVDKDNFDVVRAVVLKRRLLSADQCGTPEQLDEGMAALYEKPSPKPAS